MTWKEVIELWISEVLSKRRGYKAEEADAICQCISDMVKKNADVAPSKIYNAIGKMDVRYENPNKWYRDYYLKRDDIVPAVQAERATKREASELTKAAEEEFVRKRRCNEFQQKMREQQAAQSSITTPGAKTQPVMADYSPFGEICVGDQVHVEADLSPNKCSHGGIAHVKEKEQRGEEFEFTVDYIINGGIEKNVPYS